MTKRDQQVIITAVLKALETAGKTGVSEPKADRLSAKDAALLRTFKKRGFKDVVLMDRNNPSAPFNVRPFKGWVELGRVVRKGEKSVRGLFHVSQTEKIPEQVAA